MRLGGRRDGRWGLWRVALRIAEYRPGDGGADGDEVSWGLERGRGWWLGRLCSCGNECRGGSWGPWARR